MSSSCGGVTVWRSAAQIVMDELKKRVSVRIILNNFFHSDTSYCIGVGISKSLFTLVISKMISE